MHTRCSKKYESLLHMKYMCFPYILTPVYNCIVMIRLNAPLTKIYPRLRL